MEKYETITIETKAGKLIERRGLVVESMGGALNSPTTVAVGNTLYARRYPRPSRDITRADSLRVRSATGAKKW